MGLPPWAPRGRRLRRAPVELGGERKDVDVANKPQSPGLEPPTASTRQTSRLTLLTRAAQILLAFLRGRVRPAPVAPSHHDARAQMTAFRHHSADLVRLGTHYRKYSEGSGSTLSSAPAPRGVNPHVTPFIHSRKDDRASLPRSRRCSRRHTTPGPGSYLAIMSHQPASARMGATPPNRVDATARRSPRFNRRPCWLPRGGRCCAHLTTTSSMKARLTQGRAIDDAQRLYGERAVPARGHLSRPTRGSRGRGSWVSFSSGRAVAAACLATPAALTESRCSSNSSPARRRSARSGAPAAPALPPECPLKRHT